MEVKPRYLEETEIFREWMKIFYLIEEQNKDDNKLIDSVKNVKMSYIYKKIMPKYQEGFQKLTTHQKNEIINSIKTEHQIYEQDTKEIKFGDMNMGDFLY